MKVLSLFDGMSCGRIAFDRAGIPVEKYYASEIDKYAEIVSQDNYPDIIRLGDITKWREWGIEQPDIIIGGSPCQGFSFAGKGLNFDDPRSKLFFTFVDILKYYRPKYFLLENVKMKKEHQNVISEYLGVEPIEINSALVSAQNRKRLYWTNIPGVTQPEDKGILLKDIIESGDTDREKSYCIDASYHKGGNEKQYFEKARRQLIITGGSIRGRNPDNPTSRKSGLPTEQMLELRTDKKTGALTTVQKDNVCAMVGYADINGNESIKRVYGLSAKCPTLTAVQGGNQEPKITEDLITWRKLTVRECERLQTVPDGYCKSVSNTRAYHALGNGWTVDVIVHIFRGILNVK
jgi:DNA (cytosine-5)-methyltransferase 3A